MPVRRRSTIKATSQPLTSLFISRHHHNHHGGRKSTVITADFPNPRTYHLLPHPTSLITKSPLTLPKAFPHFSRSVRGCFAEVAFSRSTAQDSLPSALSSAGTLEIGSWIYWPTLTRTSSGALGLLGSHRLPRLSHPFSLLVGVLIALLHALSHTPRASPLGNQRKRLCVCFATRLTCGYLFLLFRPLSLFLLLATTILLHTKTFAT